MRDIMKYNMRIRPPIDSSATAVRVFFFLFLFFSPRARPPQIFFCYFIFYPFLLCFTTRKRGVPIYVQFVNIFIYINMHDICAIHHNILYRYLDIHIPSLPPGSRGEEVKS